MNQGLVASLGAALAAAGAILLLRDQTTDNDHSGETIGRLAVPRGAPDLGTRAVEVLSRHLGEHGQGPKGSAGYHRSPFIDQVNRGIYGDGQNLLGKPWCARAGRFAYETAAKELGLPPPFSQIKNTLANVSAWKSAPFRPFFVPTPKVGAALLLGEEHFTLVAEVLDGRNVVTIEGNHGDQVAHVRRTIRPQDTLVDVESYAAAARAPAPAAVGWAVRLGWVVGDLDLLDAERAA